MPSALETLVKILKLEREQGFKNTAVIGGLTDFSEKWSVDAHKQARKPEHHALADELVATLRAYDAANDAERQRSVAVMLDRILNRVQPQRSPPPQNAEAGAEGGEPQNRPPRTERRERQPRPPQAQQSQPPEGDQAQPPQEPPRQSNREAQANQGQRRDTQGGQNNQNRDNQNRNNRGRSQGQGGEQQRRPQPMAAQREGGGDSFEGGYEGGYDFEFYAGKSPAPQRIDIPARPTLARPPRKARKPVNLEEASELLRGLRGRVDTIKGIGPHKAEVLQKVGVETVNDLLFYLPRRYDDYTQLLPIARLQPNQIVTVIGTVRSTEVRIAAGGRKDFYMTIDDGTAPMPVTFFGQHWLIRQIRPDQQVVIRGVTGIYRNRIQMTNPEWEFAEADNLQAARIVPVYALTEGLSAKEIRSNVKAAVDSWADRVPDYIPEGTLERADLADLAWTIRNLHAPESFDHLRHAKRRLIFDELLMLQLAMLANRRTWQSVPGISLHVEDAWLTEFQQRIFPYPLTGAQQRAINDIRADIALDLPMNRLLQGDVGSGKTAVALTALAMAVANGKQAAIMAPTGILAEQHYRNMSAAFEKMPGDRRVVVGMLTSALSSTERESIYNGLRDGSIDVIIGTHAIIQEGVEFKDLALAVIDEQHRFGVEQRGALRGKGTNPHLLVMTATPIPRTLALTMYADLDLSIIDEMPPGRLPIQTRVIEPVARERAYNFVEDQLDQGRQAFIVYPLVEASDKIDAESAMEAYAKLQQVFYNHRVGLLHGRMKPGEKDEVMAAFREKSYDVLVTTSVAEVGVDIPNASTIMIENANRFGLAQLHQFRGRVGRGGHASYCLLVCDTNVPEARERLLALEQTTDGFKLAEIDWKLRGAGDLVGTQQSGKSTLQLVEDMSPELVDLAQREARTIYVEDPDLVQEQHQLLAQRVGMLRDDRSDLS